MRQRQMMTARLQALVLGVACALAMNEAASAANVKISGKVEAVWFDILTQQPARRPMENILIAGRFTSAGGVPGPPLVAVTDASGRYTLTGDVSAIGTLKIGAVLADNDRESPREYSWAIGASGITRSNVNFIVKVCPCIANPHPGAEKTVIYRFTARNGDMYTTQCTNTSDGGDWQWVFRPMAGAPPLPSEIAIGRCVQVGGYNMVSFGSKEINAPNFGFNHVRFHVQRNFRGTPKGAPVGHKLVVFVFDSAATDVTEKKLIIIKALKQQNGKYREQDRRTWTVQEFIDFQSFDANWQALEWGFWQDNIADVAGPEEEFNLVANESVQLLAGDCCGRVCWSVGELTPQLMPGDMVYIEDLRNDFDPRQPGSVTWYDASKFQLQEIDGGAVLTAVSSVAPVDGDKLLEYVPVKGDPSTPSNYVIIDRSATPYWVDIVGGLEFDEDVFDRPDGGGGVGQVYLARPAKYPVGDATRDGSVNVQDLLETINAWGSCPGGTTQCSNPCPADVNQDETVDTKDLLSVINNWG